MKLKNVMKKLRGEQKSSRSDPKDKESKGYDELVPMLYVLKTDGKEPTELITEIRRGQEDRSVFFAQLDLSDKLNGIDVDQINDIKSLTFDMNNNFLLGVGTTEFFVVDLRENRDH